MMDIKILKNIRCGRYVQFDISGDMEQYTFWHNESSYLYEPIYGIFADCFEACAERFIYYGPTLFTISQLVQLRQALEIKQRVFVEIETPEEFISRIFEVELGENFLTELSRQNCNLNTNWRVVADSLMEINEGLIDLVDNCMQSGRVLWVLGI